MEMTWIMIGFFTIVTLIFVSIAILFPELVGIQGKKAKEIESSHRENEVQIKADKPEVKE